MEKIKNKNSFETQRILALEFNQPPQIHEKIKPQKNNSVRIELTLTQEQFAELEQAKSLLSHVCPDGNLNEVIYTIAKIYNKKKLQGRSYSLTNSTRRVIVTASNTSMTVDSTSKSAFDYISMPIMKSKSKSTSTSTSTSTSVSASILTTSEPILSPSPIPETTSSLASELTSPPLQLLSPSTFSQRPRKYIALKTKRSLLEKGQYCCEYFDPHSNKRCASKYQLQLDHIQPWSLGGSKRN